MPAEDASTWFLPFVMAAFVAGLCIVALLAALAVHRRQARQILAALLPLAPRERSPTRAARRAADEAARQDEALRELRSIIEAAPFGIVALDKLGRVATMNPAACRMLGLSARQSHARLLIELVRAPELEALLATAHQTGRTAEGELNFHLAGSRHIARAVAAPHSSSGTDASCVVVLEDLTELRRLESVRSDFVSNVSHELRTPVTNVRGYAETLLTSFHMEPQARSFVETIQRNATRLGAIIDDLLLLASLESSRAEPMEMTPVQLSAVLREGIEQHAEAAARKSTTVDCECPAPLTVLGSAGLLGQAIGNLIENAIKYSPDASRVLVKARADGPQAVIEVQDQGPGIPAQHLPRIFERFYRVDKARSRESGGTGLGLSIVKHVAQTHGGSVEVESRSGVGSCFRVRLPLAAQDLRGT